MGGLGGGWGWLEWGGVFGGGWGGWLDVLGDCLHGGVFLRELLFLGGVLSGLFSRVGRKKKKMGINKKKIPRKAQRNKTGEVFNT